MLTIGQMNEDSSCRQRVRSVPRYRCAFCTWDIPWGIEVFRVLSSDANGAFILGEGKTPVEAWERAAEFVTAELGIIGPETSQPPPKEELKS